MLNGDVTLSNVFWSIVAATIFSQASSNVFAAETVGNSSCRSSYHGVSDFALVFVKTVTSLKSSF